MAFKHGFLKKKSIVDILNGKLFLSAFADEGNDKKPEGSDSDNKNDGNDNGGSSTIINYEDLIAKARREEKEKLYPKIKALEKEKEQLVGKCNEYLLAIGQKDAEIEQLKKRLQESGKDDSEEVKRLKDEISRLENELEEAKKNVPDEKAIEDRIRAEYEIKLYREQVVGQHRDEIIPELVTGSTKEEIDASLEVAKKRFKEISDKILKGNNLGGKGGTSGIPPANTSYSNFKSLKIEDIAKLDPRSPEYKEFRRQLGLR